MAPGIDNLLGSVGKVDAAGIRRCCRKGASCNVCNPPEAHNSSLDIKDPVGYVRLLKTVLDQERNVCQDTARPLQAASFESALEAQKLEETENTISFGLYKF